MTRQIDFKIYIAYNIKGLLYIQGRILMLKKNVSVNVCIKQIRKSKNLSQQELADKLGIDRSTLSKYELEERLPNIYALCDIADELDVSLDDLVHWERKE